LSLLNDMLRDLSQQEKSLSAPELQENKLSQANLAQNSDRELFEQSSLATIKRIPWLPSIVVFCSVLIISLLVKHYVVQKEPAAVVAADVVENTKTKESTIGITPIVEISTDNIARHWQHLRADLIRTIK